MDKLLQYISSKVRLSPDARSNLTTKFQREALPQGQILIRKNRVAERLYYIESGIFRSYYDHEDKDVTSWFYMENQWMTSWHSFYAQQPSFENIEALENAVVYSITKDQMVKLVSESSQIESFMRMMAEEQVSFMDVYFKGYMFMSAKEKYDLLIATYPTIESKVKLGYIASYLGISQETLSRVRSQK